jgi:endoglucanase
MWKWIFGAVLIGAASAAQPQPVQQPASAFDQPFHRGVNVLGYDPYWTDPANRRFQWSHFSQIRRGGFDFVRVNLQAFKFMDAEKRLDPAWLAKLDDVVREAQKAGLGVILDEHDFDKCSTDIAACGQQLKAFWTQVAPRYANAPRNVAFELLNEPHDKLNGEPWNSLLAELLPIVRQTNPTRIVVVGPTHWNSLKDLPQLKLPEDPNLLVTFHYYEPFGFTHQGATWAGEEVKRLHGITWGTAQDRAAIGADFDQVAAWSKANRRPILLGEFGAYDKTGTPVELRAAYTAADRCEAERRGFSWAYWQFEGDFIAWDMKQDDWVQPVKDALIPVSQSANARTTSDCEEIRDMVSGKLAAAALMAAAPSAVVAAQDAIDPAKQIVNDPSAPDVNGAKASLISDPKVQGGTALRVDVPRKGNNPWDSSVGGVIKKPIAKGDRLVLLFSARLHKGEGAAATATLPYNAIQLAAAPYSTIISGPAEIGAEWKDFQVTGTADGNYPAGALKVTIQLATAKQTVDFGPIVVLDRGK